MTRRPWKWRPMPLVLVSGHAGLVSLFQETLLLVSCQNFSYCTTTTARLVHHRARSWQQARPWHTKVLSCLTLPALSRTTDHAHFRLCSGRSSPPCPPTCT